MKFPFSQSALRWCKGAGLEIGGSAHNPFGLNTLNVDITEAMTIFKEHELRICGEFLRVDIVTVDGKIPVADASQDFVVSSHVLEHYNDPVRALLEWSRVICAGGILYMIIPHKDRTFDRDRTHTPLQHHIDDYNNAVAQLDLYSAAHAHVWATEDLHNLLKWMLGRFPVEFPMEIVEILDVDDKVGNGFTFVLKKAK